ncbi:MAG: hypothetical protein GQ569_10720 [Methylococcaceae bacterium]|nr:hypothetical protein [Methylococcaceae bacterium]
MNNQKLIQALSLSAAGLLFVVEVIPFVTGYENLPALIKEISADQKNIDISVENNINLPAAPSAIEKPLPPPVIPEIASTAVPATTSAECGEHWSKWTAVGRNITDPCPENCQKGQSLETEKRLQGFPPKPQIKHKFQCIKST